MGAQPQQKPSFLRQFVLSPLFVVLLGAGMVLGGIIAIPFFATSTTTYTATTGAIRTALTTENFFNVQIEPVTSTDTSITTLYPTVNHANLPDYLDKITLHVTEDSGAGRGYSGTVTLFAVSRLEEAMWPMKHKIRLQTVLLDENGVSDVSVEAGAIGKALDSAATTADTIKEVTAAKTGKIVDTTKEAFDDAIRGAMKLWTSEDDTSTRAPADAIIDGPETTVEESLESADRSEEDIQWAKTQITKDARNPVDSTPSLVIEKRGGEITAFNEQTRSVDTTTTSYWKQSVIICGAIILIGVAILIFGIFFVFSGGRFGGSGGDIDAIFGD